MKPSDLALLRTPSDPTLSPDGERVVVAVQRIDLDADAYRSELWLVPTDGSAPPRQLTNGPRDSRPRFSPDGRWIAFLRAGDDAPAQLHLLPADGGESRRLTDAPLGVGDHAWSPDSSRLVYTSRVPQPGRYGTDEDIPADKEPPRRITTRKYRVDDLGFTVDRRAHVFVVAANADDGAAEPVQLTSGDFDATAPVFSPDGAHVAFISARHAGRDADLITDVLVAPADGGDARQVTDTTRVIGAAAFTPDGATLCLLTPSAADVVGRSTVVATVPVDGSAAPQVLTDVEAFDFDSYGTGSATPLLVDEHSVTTLSQRRGALELVRVPLDGSAPTVVVGGRRQVLAADRAAGVMALVVSTDTNAGELVVVGRDGSERTLSDFGVTLARATSLRPMVELDATAPDGYPVHGWVVKPVGSGPFPVLLAIHGGPHTQYGWDLFDEAQVYAGAGYAVVLGNPRGSSGHGESHARAIVGDLGNRDAADLLALLDAALRDADLDADRVGVMGGSYGGFMTTWLVGHGDRFRAAISERAVNAWDSFTGSSDIGWFFTDAYCGPDPRRQREQSPLTYADAIRTPMLLIHSEHDWRCPVEQAQRLFERLLRNGVPAELLLFPGEGHELSRSGLPSHRVARFDAILDWWHRHLGP
ncbi:MAG: S9 family peptidase [Actinomycetota bacterium]|nr:S9 family peptidase [Actinomycetota bacterium]